MKKFLLTASVVAVSSVAFSAFALVPPSNEVTGTLSTAPANNNLTAEVLPATSIILTGVTSVSASTPIEYSGSNTGTGVLTLSGAFTTLLGSAPSTTSSAVVESGTTLTGTVSSGTTASMEIASGTTIYSSSGTLAAIPTPRLDSSASGTVTNSGVRYTFSSGPVEFGSPSDTYIYSQPVRLRIRFSVAYSAVLYRIPGQIGWNVVPRCTVPGQPTFPRECYDPTAESDGIQISTFHTTTFAAVSQVVDIGGAPKTTSSGGGGSVSAVVSTGTTSTGSTATGATATGSANPVVTINASGSVVVNLPTATGSTGSTFLPFNDVPASHWSSEFVNALKKLGVVSGYENGTIFKPESAVTRAEFLKMALKGLNVVATGTVSPFADVTETWQVSLVAKAKELKIVNGQEINGKLSFRPNDSITRAEAIKILLGAAKIEAKATTTDFVDVTTDWQIPFVAKAKELGIVSGQEINGKLSFRPNDTITRAEVSKIVVKVLALTK